MSKTPLEETDELLQDLQPRLLRALALRREGKEAEAEKQLRAILSAEPRLAEPRLELAHIAAMREDWEEAEAEARLAVATLRAGGQWTSDLTGEQLLSFALNLLGETIVRNLEEGTLLLEDQVRFAARWNEAYAIFQEAAATDPGNSDARRNLTRYPRLTLDAPSGEA